MKKKPTQEIAIHRMPSSQRGVIIDKEQIQNPKMSLKATGLYCYICSMPDGWIIRREDLMRKKHLGHNALQTIINELKTLGYLKTVTHRDTKGRVLNKSYEFYEYPISTFANPCKSNTSIHNSKNRKMDDVPPHPPTEKHELSEQSHNVHDLPENQLTRRLTKTEKEMFQVRGLIKLDQIQQYSWKRTPKI